MKRLIEWYISRLITAVKRNECIKAFKFSERISEMVKTLMYEEEKK